MLYKKKFIIGTFFFSPYVTFIFIHFEANFSISITFRFPLYDKLITSVLYFISITAIFQHFVTNH